MAFPVPEILIELLERLYIENREPKWASPLGIVKDNLKWAVSFTPITKYQDPKEKREIYNSIKKDILTPPANPTKEIEKWTNICIKLGTKATECIEHEGKTSLLAKTLHFLRSYILYTLYSNEHTAILLDGIISNLSANVSSDAKSEPSKSYCDKLYDLVYLNSSSHIAIARKQGLLPQYTFDESGVCPFFTNNYFETVFFNERIKPKFKVTHFSEFELDIKKQLEKEKTTKMDLHVKTDEPSPKNSLTTTEIISGTPSSLPPTAPVKEEKKADSTILPEETKTQAATVSAVPTDKLAKQDELVPTPTKPLEVAKEKSETLTGTSSASTSSSSASSSSTSSPGSALSHISFLHRTPGMTNIHDINSATLQGLINEQDRKQEEELKKQLYFKSIFSQTTTTQRTHLQDQQGKPLVFRRV